MRELVLDISKYDQGIDLAEWKRKRNLWGVIIKFGGNQQSQGGRYHNKTSSSEFYKQAKDLGLHIGAYYYSDVVDSYEAKKDAEYFASLLSGYEFDLPCYIDIEEPRQFELSKRLLTDLIKAFCDRLNEFGYYAGVYTGGSAWLNNVYKDELLCYANWIAWWRSTWPTSAGNIGMWQQGCMNLNGNIVYDDIGAEGYHDVDWCAIDYPAIIKAKNTTQQPSKSEENSAKKEDTVTSLRQKVVELAKSQIGVRYYSMHEGPRGSKDEGFGCAMLGMWCWNQVLGTHYYGSCYNVYGEAIGATVYNQGGKGAFEVVDIPKPGDVVCYFKGYDTGRSTLCGHLAVYIGDGQVIGAWGQYTPGDPRWWGSVRQTSVDAQRIGGTYLFVRCKALDAEDDIPSITYRAHVAKVGWMTPVTSGGIAGTTGRSLALEAIKITPPEGVTLRVLVHVQDKGDLIYDAIKRGISSGTGSSANDPIIGTTGQSKRIEGVQIDVMQNTNTKLQNKRLVYRVHQQGSGWSKWVSNGTFVGSRGKGLRLEAIEMKFV